MQYFTKNFKAVIVGVVLTVLTLGVGFANASPIADNWLNRPGNNLYTNSGNGLGNATIHVAACVGCGGGPSTVVTDSSLTGNGALLTPLSLNIQTDGTLSGHGNSGSPLSVVGGTQGGGSVIASKTATTASLINTDVTSYNNGISGVGATITENINGLLPAQDGVTLLVGQRLLVKNQTTVLQNGVYVVTNLGGVGSKYILTRSTDSDSSSEFDNQLVQPTAGTLECPINQNCTEWAQTTSSPVVGTDSIVYVVFTGSYVSQAVGGVQLAQQIPIWNAPARVLSKGTTDLLFNPVTKVLNVGAIDGIGQISIGSNFFGRQNFGFGNLAVGSSSNINTAGTAHNVSLGAAAGGALITGSADFTGVGFHAGSNVTTGTGNTFVGSLAGNLTTTEVNVTILGAGSKANVGVSNAVVLGHNATSNANGQFVVSGNPAIAGGPITDEYLGLGPTTQIPINITVHGGDVSSILDTAGGNHSFNGGMSTGTAVGGDVIMSVTGPAPGSGATQNALVEGLRVKAPVMSGLNPVVRVSNSYNLPVVVPVLASNQTVVYSSSGVTTFGPSVNSGTYTPVSTNVTNITASTPNNTSWSRVGSIVTEAGSITVTNTIAVASEVDISLGVASNFLLATDLNGTANMDSTASVNMYVKGDAVNHRASIFFTSAGIGQTSTIYFTFQYNVV